MYLILSKIAEHQFPGGGVFEESVTRRCQLCQLVFDSPSKLQRHLIEHACQAIRPSSSSDEASASSAVAAEFRCPACPARCPDASALQAHLLGAPGLHSPAHACQFCALRFFFNAELQNHLLAEHALDQLSVSDLFLRTIQQFKTINFLEISIKVNTHVPNLFNFHAKVLLSSVNCL